MKENINNTWYSINKRSSKSSSTQFNILPTSNESEFEVGKKVMTVANSFIDNAIVYTSITDITKEDGCLIFTFANGLTFNCGKVQGEKLIIRKTSLGIEYRYEDETDNNYKLLVPIDDILFKFENLTKEQRDALAFHFSDFTEEEIKLLQQPALDIVLEANKAVADAKKIIDSTKEAKKVADSIIIEAQKVVDRTKDYANNPPQIIEDEWWFYNEETKEIENSKFPSRGRIGKSAYESACDNGFIGTEKEWIDSLNGEDGNPGTGNVNISNKNNLIANKKYLFLSTTSSTPDGEFVEFTDHTVATTEQDGLMSKDDKAKLDQMKGGDIEVSKANVEKVLIGDITSHTHDRLIEVEDMPTDVWDGVTVSTALAGSGTVADPYLIKSCADYIHFYRNPSLYSYAMVGDGPTPEMLANPKQIKFTSNLDFDNHSLDFGDLLVNPNKSADEEMFSKSLVLVNVDGQGCNLSNVNFLNTWTVLPFGAYSAVRNLHVISGILTIAANTINDLGFAKAGSSNPDALSPWTLLAGMSIIENVSFVAEIKLTGDIELQLMFVGGPVVLRVLESIITSGISGKSYFHSNITFSADAGLTKTLVVAYSPAIINDGQSNSISVVGYDCTHAITEEPTEESLGLMVGMLIDSNDCNPYTLYVNTDNALPMYDSSSITPFHTGKTTAEMKSPEFLALLNGDTETFVADTENVNDGYPIFKPAKIEHIVYDGYIKESVFKSMVENFDTGIIRLDIDVTGSISNLPQNNQMDLWGKIYETPTNDNIIRLLGGVEGINALARKLSARNSKCSVVCPVQLVYFPGVLQSSVNVLLLFNSTNNKYLDTAEDGCEIYFTLQFFMYINRSEITIYIFNVHITDFNLPTQTVDLNIKNDSTEPTLVYDYLNSSNSTYALSANQGRILKDGLDKKVESTDITTIKKLSQSAYDALSSKDSKTLYIIVG